MTLTSGSGNLILFDSMTEEGQPSFHRRAIGCATVGIALFGRATAVSLGVAIFH